MMSNGPCSRRRSVHSGGADDLDGLDLLRCAQHPDAAEALALQPLQRAAAAASAGGGRRARRSRGRAGRVALVADRLGQVEDDRRPGTGRARGRARPAACAPRAARWWRRRRSAAAARQAPRRDERAGPRTRPRWRPGRSRRRTTSPRQKSEEMTSVGLKWRAGERALAGAGRADQDDEAGDREARSSSLEHRHLRRRPDLGVLGTDRQDGAPVAVRPATAPAHACELLRASTRSGGRGGGTGRPEASPSARCTRRWAS